VCLVPAARSLLIRFQKWRQSRRCRAKAFPIASGPPVFNDNSRYGRRTGVSLRKQQSNFAGEPWRAPVKTHLTTALTFNHVFYNAGAASAMRGGRDGRPA
jgi:hypothetical protein